MKLFNFFEKWRSDKSSKKDEATKLTENEEEKDEAKLMEEEINEIEDEKNRNVEDEEDQKNGTIEDEENMMTEEDVKGL